VRRAAVIAQNKQSGGAADAPATQG